MCDFRECKDIKKLQVITPFKKSHRGFPTLGLETLVREHFFFINDRISGLRECVP